MKQQTILEDKRPALTVDRFNNPAFVKEYVIKHSKMSVSFAKIIAAKLSKRNLKHCRILDAGCGSGFTLIELAKKFHPCEFYGIDLSGPMLEIAEDKKQKEKLSDRVRFLKADVQNIPFPDSYFEVVININMLHLVSEPVKMLNEIERVLKPDGFFFITDIRRSFLGYIEREIKSAFTVKEVKEIIAKSNLAKGRFSSKIIWWRYQTI